MTYNVSDLVASVRKRAKDPTFDEDLIIEFMQSKQDALLNHNRFPFMETSETENISASSLDLELDSEIDVLLDLKLIDADTNNVITPGYLPFGQFQELYESPETSSVATPYQFTSFSNILYWNAPVDKSYTLKMRYIRTPIRFTSGLVVPDVPERYKEILIRAGLAGVEEYRENFDIAAVHERKIEELTEDMLMRLSLRQLTTPHKARFGVR
jgi:hypothetical protein